MRLEGCIAETRLETPIRVRFRLSSSAKIVVIFQVSEVHVIPSSAEEGWMRGKEKLRSNLSPRRRGGVGQEILWTSTTPAAPAKDASRYFLGSRPPLLS